FDLGFRFLRDFVAAFALGEVRLRLVVVADGETALVLNPQAARKLLRQSGDNLADLPFQYNRLPRTLPAHLAQVVLRIAQQYRENGRRRSRCSTVVAITDSGVHLPSKCAALRILQNGE